MFKLLPCAFVCFSASLAAADQIAYRVNGGSENTMNITSGQNVTIPLGAISGAMTLHIYDNDGTGADTSIGMVTVTGYVNTSASLRVLVANESESISGAFSVPSDILGSGFANFGGLQFTHAGTSSNPTLRENAVVSVNVTGDITGDITAGQLFRIDARYDGDNDYDSDDIVAFFADWDNGEPGADMDFDQDVDSDDIASFFYWWDNGGC